MSTAQTLAEKVMSRLAGRPVRADDFVELAPDWTFKSDDGIGLVDRYFKLHKVERIAAPEKIAIFYDHFAPATHLNTRCAAACRNCASASALNACMT